MREQFKHWPSKVKGKKWWMVGAMATPIFLWMVWWLWLLPDRQPQVAYDRLLPEETAPLPQPRREALISGFGTVAMVAGGVLLLLNLRIGDSQAQGTNLSNADFQGADLAGVDFQGADLACAELSGANLCEANLSGANLGGANLNGTALGGANLSGANLGGANLVSANLNGANLDGAELKYADLSGADLRYTNLSGADLRYANLSGADLNCALLAGANFCDANLSGALLFYLNSQYVLNLEPLQLEAAPSPYLCNVALPSYSKKPPVNPNRDCDRIPHLLSARYGISLEEAQGIVNEARQHRWD
jgi:hypothetical protein